MIEIHKQKMINDLIQIINSWNEYSKIIYGYSKKDAENFLKRLQIGVYNSILKNKFWFATIPFLDTLIQIEIKKKELNSFTNITEENYIVYSAIHEIKNHIDYIYYWNKAYKCNYQTKINNYFQTPQTRQEQEHFNNLYNNVLQKNYSWQNAKNIINELEKLNIKENENFPHNIQELEKIFNTASKPLCYKYNEQVKYSTSILNLNQTTNNLLKNINNGLEYLLNSKTQNIYEEYIKQLIINCERTNTEEIKQLLNTLITPKKCIDISNLNIPQPLLTKIKKHYNFIYQHTSELEFLEESTEILKNIKEIYKDDIYNITLIYNSILISNGIIPIILTKEILSLKDNNLIIKIIEETINQANNLNKEKGKLS